MEHAVAFAAIVSSVASYVYYSSRGLTLAYDDALSHMMIARRTVVGRTPGLAQLGQFWLPLTHMMMMPLVWIDVLFRTGLAGIIPSMLSYVVGTVYMYRLSRMLFSSRAAGWLSASVFMLNPSLLYMQATAMTEAPLISAAVIAIYYAARWAKSEVPFDLVKAGIATAAGTLIRYDGWPLAVALAAVVVGIAWRRHGWGAARAYSILFGTMAFSGCVAWILYNQILYGNGFDWYNGKYSAQFQEVRIDTRNSLPTHGNALLSLRIYLQTVIDSVGMPVLVLAGLGLVAWCVFSRLNLRTWPVYASLVPFAFNWLSLERGITVLRTPEFPINGAATWFNVRYGMEMIPAVALFLGIMVAHRFRRLQAVTLGALVSIVIIYAVSNTVTSIPYVLHDPLQKSQTGVVLQQQSIGQYLSQHYTDGTILVSYSPFAPAVFYSNLPDRTFVTDANGKQYLAALAQPQNNDVTWIVMDPGSINYDPVADYFLKHHPNWMLYYMPVTNIGTAQIWMTRPIGGAKPDAK
jgi:Dolichyl-phosphate-mannose-protein mannosyltransferase